MTPLAGGGVGAHHDLAPHHQCAAHAGAEDDPEHHLGPCGGAIGRLGKGEAVGVVGERDRAAEPRLQGLPQGLPFEPGQVDDHADLAIARDDAGEADADARRAHARCCEPVHDLGDGVDHAVEARGHRLAQARALPPSPSRAMAASFVPPMSIPICIVAYCVSGVSLRAPPIQVARTRRSSSSQTRSARSPGASDPGSRQGRRNPPDRRRPWRARRRAGCLRA